MIAAVVVGPVALFRAAAAVAAAIEYCSRSRQLKWYCNGHGVVEVWWHMMVHGDAWRHLLASLHMVLEIPV